MSGSAAVPAEGSRAPRRRSRIRPGALLVACGLLAAFAPLVALGFLADSIGTPAGAKARVATLLPYVAEALDRVSEDSGAVRVVAQVPPQAGAPLPPGRLDLGSPHAMNFEHLAASRPDVVVADRRLHGAHLERLRRVAGEVVVVEASSVEATFEGLLRVARAASVEPAMARRVADTRARLQGLRLQRPVRVLPLFGAPGSYMAITGGTWLGDLLGEIGLRNLADELAGQESAYPGYVEISEEVLATVRPDLVLLVTHGSPEAVAEDFRRRGERGGAWALLAQRVVLLEPELFARNPGLDMDRAARVLVAHTESVNKR